jgi:hypothetical protein
VRTASQFAGAQAHANTIAELGSSENVLLTSGPLSARKRDKKEYVRFINWEHMVRLGLSCKIEEDSINEVVSFFHVRTHPLRSYHQAESRRWN